MVKVNEPSLEKRILQAEAIMHVMLDHIIDKQPMDFSGLFLPNSIIERLRDGLNSGKIKGKLETD